MKKKKQNAKHDAKHNANNVIINKVINRSPILFSCLGTVQVVLRILQPLRQRPAPLSAHSGLPRELLASSPVNAYVAQAIFWSRANLVKSKKAF